MHKLQLIYYPIMISLLLSSQVCAERQRIAALDHIWSNPPHEIKDLNDIADNLQLSALLSGHSDFCGDFQTPPTRENSVPDIAIHMKKIANHQLTQRFIPSSADPLKIDSLMTGISYRVNQQLSIEGTMIGQVATFKKQQDWESQEPASETVISPSFTMAALYRLSENTQIDAVYHQGLEYELVLAGQQQDFTSRSPQKIGLGVQHFISNELTLAVRADWQKWSSVDDEYDDIYSAGTAVSYQLNNWTLASALSVDTPLLAIENNNPLSAIEPQWHLGFSGTRKINNLISFDLEYQYQSLSEFEMNRDISGQNSSADSQERVHFISTKLSF